MLIRTPIDDIVEYVKEQKSRVNVVDLSKKFNIALKTLETWLVVLEYKKIVKIHYIAFQEFVEFNFDNQKHLKKIGVKNENNAILNKEFDNIKKIPECVTNFVLIEKNNFVNYCLEKNIEPVKANFLWKNYIKQNLNYAKNMFYQYAKELNIELEKIDLIWQRYLEKLTV